MAGQTVVVSVLADTKKFSDGMAKAGGSASKLKTGLKAVGLGLGALVVGVGALAAKAFNDLREAEVIAAQTSAVLDSTAGAAGRTQGQIEKLAGSLSKLSGVEDEAIQKGQNMLLTFTQIKGDTFDAATKAALDLSVAMGKDMTSSATLVGKALNDPIKGIGALSKVGVQLTADQKGLIKSLVETGDVAGAQAVILGELNTQFGGSAEAFGKTFDGSLGRVKVALGNLGETLMSGLLPAATAALGGFATLLEGVGDNPAFVRIVEQIGSFATALFNGTGPIGEFGGAIASILPLVSPFALIFKALAPVLPTLSGAFQQLGAALSGALVSILPTLQSLLSTLISTLSGIFAAVLPVVIGLVIQLAGVFTTIAPTIASLGKLLASTLAKVLPIIGELFASIAKVLGTVLAAILPVIADLFSAIAGVLKKLAPIFVQLVGFVAELFEAFAPLIVTLGKLLGAILPPLIRLFSAILGPVIDLAGGLLKSLMPAIKFVVSALSTVIGWIAKAITFFVKLVTGSKDTKKGIEGVWNGILKFFGSIPKKIGSFFSGAVNWLAGAGKNIIQGLLNGAGGLLRNIGSFFLNMVPGWILGPFKAALGIRSPSRVMARLGEYTIEGLEKGLSQLNGVRSAMGAVSGAVTSGYGAELAPAGAPSGRYAGGGGNVYQITVQAIAPGYEVGRAIVEAIDDYERIGGRRR